MPLLGEDALSHPQFCHREAEERLLLAVLPRRVVDRAVGDVEQKAHDVDAHPVNERRTLLREVAVDEEPGVDLVQFARQIARSVPLRDRHVAVAAVLGTTEALLYGVDDGCMQAVCAHADDPVDAHLTIEDPLALRSSVEQCVLELKRVIVDAEDMGIDEPTRRHVSSV